MSDCTCDGVREWQTVAAATDDPSMLQCVDSHIERHKHSKVRVVTVQRRSCPRHPRAPRVTESTHACACACGILVRSSFFLSLSRAMCSLSDAHRYIANAGLPTLREAVADRVTRDTGVSTTVRRAPGSRGEYTRVRADKHEDSPCKSWPRGS